MPTGSSPVGRGAFGPLLTPNLYRIYVETGKEHPMEHPIWVNVIDMPWNPVTDQQITGIGSAQSMPEGAQYPSAAPILGNTKSYKAEPYGLLVEFTFPMWQDELFGIMNEMIAELARASRDRMEIAAHAVLNRAFDTNFTGFTATSLCSTSHASIDGTTTFANRPATDVSFGVTYLQGASLRFENLKNEANQPRLLAPVMAIISPENKYVAREVLGSSGRPYKSDNELNALVEDDLRYHVNHRLTNVNAAFLLAAKANHDLNFMVRTNPMFDSFDDPRTKNAAYGVYQRHDESDWGSFRGIDGTPGGS